MKISRCLLFITGLFIIGCRDDSTNAEQATTSAAPTTELSSLEEIIPQALGTYEGTIPCADCEGIHLELTLEDNLADNSRTFLLRETYIGTPGENNTVESRGTWTILDGPEENPTATIFQLDPDQTTETRYFVRLSDTEIEMLSRNMQEIDTSLNYRLHKQL